MADSAERGKPTMIRKLFVCGLLMVANLLAFGGCFAYVPVEPAAAPVGQEVRVYITPQEMAALRELDDQGLPYSNGPPSVSGILTSRDGSGLTLRIPVATRQNLLAPELDLSERRNLTQLSRAVRAATARPRAYGARCGYYGRPRGGNRRIDPRQCSAPDCNRRSGGRRSWNARPALQFFHPVT